MDGTRRTSGGHPLPKWMWMLRCLCPIVQNAPGDVHMCDAPGNRKALLFNQWPFHSTDVSVLAHIQPFQRRITTNAHIHTATHTLVPSKVSWGSPVSHWTMCWRACCQTTWPVSECVFLCEAHCPIINGWAGPFGPQSILRLILRCMKICVGLF